MIEEGRAFVEASSRLGVDSELFTAEAQKHAFFNRTPWLESAASQMHDFLFRHHYLEAPSDIGVDVGAIMLSDEVKA